MTRRSVVAVGAVVAGVARALGVATVLSIALALGTGCSTESKRAQGDAANDYFPMLKDARWVYSVQASVGKFKVEVTARGDMQLPGGRGSVFIVDERNLGPSFGFAEVAPVGYLVQDGYVARLTGVDYADSGELRLLGQYEPTWILPLGKPVGYSWSQQNALFSTPEGGGAQLGWSGTIKPRTTVSVPAGRFDDVLEIETLYSVPAGDSPGLEVIYRDFYARGVGLVRSITEDPSGNDSNRIEQVLLEYSIP